LLRLRRDHLAQLDGLVERLTQRIDGLLFTAPGPGGEQEKPRTEVA
jgi:hypothetical protein